MSTDKPQSRWRSSRWANSTGWSSRLSCMNRLSRRSLLSCIGCRSSVNRNRTPVARTGGRLIIPTGTVPAMIAVNNAGPRVTTSVPAPVSLRGLLIQAWFSLRLARNLNFQILSPNWGYNQCLAKKNECGTDAERGGSMNIGFRARPPTSLDYK